jgi:propanol-preferring alcohol dehydrogenase
MKALRFKNWKTPPVFEDIAVPEPAPGEVLIKMGGAGVCHSDLHVMHEWTPEILPQLAGFQLPFTLGHENAGWIEGGDTRGLDIGAPVAISPVWGCGKCRSCSSGNDNYCDYPNPLGSGGLGRNGGIADYMVAPASALVALDKLKPSEAAPLTDAGLTSYHAVKSCLPALTPDTTIVVIGVGGLGHLAVELLSLLSGAQIIAIDKDDKALQMAADRGADLCLPSDENAAAAIRDATKGIGAMVVMDFVGIDATLTLAAQSLRKMGQIVLVGIGGGTLPYGFATLPTGCSIRTTLGGSTAELGEVVALAEAGKIKPHIETFAMTDALAVYEKLHHGDISGRAVLIP